jgi:hypothetical protein
MRVCRSLYLAVGLLLGAACASDSEPMTPPDPPEPDPTAVDRVDDNLTRLRALEVFDVGDLVLDDGETIEAAATQLETLAATAEAACATTEVDPALCTPASIEQNLGELRDMRVVEVGELLAVEPANNPNCYNLPCQEDIAAAEAETCARATKLGNIVAATKRVY